MIKLDPEEEVDDDDQPLMKTPQKIQMPPPNTSQATINDNVTMNHLHMNNVQINLPRNNLPAVASPQNFVSLNFKFLKINLKLRRFLRRKQST